MVTFLSKVVILLVMATWKPHWVKCLKLSITNWDLYFIKWQLWRLWVHSHQHLYSAVVQW